MKFASVLLVFAIASAIAAEPKNEASTAQTHASFETAIHNISTAPSYVLITVVDAKTNTAQSVCTTGNFLMGAIHREFDLAYDKEGGSKAVEIAMANKEHVFRFTKKEALDNVAASYSSSDLERVRAELAPLSVEQLIAGFATTGEGGKLHSLYLGKRSLNDLRATRDAVACVLIERGLSPRRGDRPSIIFLTPPR